MKSEAPEYNTTEFFPSTNINFIDKKSKENELER